MKLIAMCSLLLFLIGANCQMSHAQWLQTNGPFGGSISCFASSGPNLFAGSSDGAGVFVSTDYGASWKSANGGLPNTVVRSLVVNGTSILAGTNNGIFQTFDNGRTWANIGFNVVQINAFVVTSTSNGGTNIFVGGMGPLPIYVSTNNGISWRSPTNSGLTTQSVYALIAGSNSTGGSTLYAGTGSGIFVSTNDGASWKTFNTGLTSVSVHAMAVGPDGAGGTKIFLGTSGGGVFRLSQDSTTWVAANKGLTSLNILSLVASNSTLYAGTYDGGVFASTDGGRNWTAVNIGLTTNQVSALLLIPASGGSGNSLFAGTDRGVFLSANDGTNWIASNAGLSNTSIYALIASGANILAGTTSGIFLSSNSGSSWIPVNTGLTNTIVDALAIIPASAGSGTNLFAGTAGGVFLSTNNGTNWTAVNTGLANTMVLALAASGTNLFAGTTGGVFLSTNNGTSWKAVNSGLTNNTVLSLVASGTNVFAGTNDGGVFLSTDNGTTWKMTSNGLTNAIINALAVIPNPAGGAYLFAGTNGGGVFLSTNNGTSWSAVGLATQTVWALAVSGTSLFAGDNFGIWSTTDNGANWRTAGTGLTNNNVYALAVKGTDLLAGTFGSGVWKRPLLDMVPATPTWINQSSPLGTQSLGQIQFVNSAEGWIVAGNGSLLHTTNSGSGWTVVKPSGTDTVSFNTDNMGSLSPLCFVNPSTGWVMGTSGQYQNAAGAVLFKTTNGGASWSKQSLVGWTLGFGVQFVDANNGWAEVVNGNSTAFTYAILRTTDGGNQWASVYTSNSALCYPRFVDASNGWAIIVSTGTYSIVRTTDAGSTWNNQFSDNTPGSVRRIQFIDANNGWVVGDSAKIFHTTNGGATWTRLTNSGANGSSSLNALFFLNGNIGWIGGQVASGSVPAFVLHTTNGGVSWSMQGGASWAAPNKSPVQANILGLFFVDANTGWMTTHWGDLAKTTTGGEITAVSENHSVGLPNQFTLKQNYPNPFNPSTTIRFELQKEAIVSLRIFNTLGQLVTTLVDEPKRAGAYQVQWNASNVPSGTYFYRLKAAGCVEIRKMIVLK